MNAAVKALRQELCLGEEAVQTGADAEEEIPGEEAPAELPEGPPEETEPVSGNLSPEEAPVCPPCPWTIRFYPSGDTAEIVEILLHSQWPKAVSDRPQILEW